MKIVLLATFLATILLMTKCALSLPSDYGYEQEDNLPSETGHHKAKGRLHIKVYRGPSDGHHAPWGYWLKHPEDDKHHHHKAH